MSPSVVNTLTQQKPITTTEKDTPSSPPLTSSPEIPRGKMDPDFNVTHQTENYHNNSPTSSVMDNPNADQNYVDHDSRHQEFDNSDLATPIHHIDQNPIDINNPSSCSAIDNPNTDQNHIDHDNIQHYSDFATPNPYACLAEQEQPDVDSISLENIEKAPRTPTLQITPTGAPKNTEEFGLNKQVVTQSTPSGKSPYFNRICEKCIQKYYTIPSSLCNCVSQGRYPDLCICCDDCSCLVGLNSD